MAEFTFTINVDGLPDPRLEELDDLYEALVDYGGLLGPALAGDLSTGRLSLVVTVEGRNEQAAGAVAGAALGHALIATGRTPTIATVFPALPVAS